MTETYGSSLRKMRHWSTTNRFSHNNRWHREHHIGVATACIVINSAGSVPAYSSTFQLKCIGCSSDGVATHHHHLTPGRTITLKRGGTSRRIRALTAPLPKLYLLLPAPTDLFSPLSSVSSCFRFDRESVVLPDTVGTECGELTNESLIGQKNHRPRLFVAHASVVRAHASRFSAWTACRWCHLSKFGGGARCVCSLAHVHCRT